MKSSPPRVKIGRTWHVARTFGYRNGLSEAYTLCGREKSGMGFICYQPWPEPRCKSCIRFAAMYGWE